MRSWLLIQRTNPPALSSIFCWKAGLRAKSKSPGEEHLQILLDWKNKTHQEHCGLQHLLRFLILQSTKIPANSKPPLLKIKICSTDCVQKSKQNRYIEFCDNSRTYNFRTAYYSSRKEKKKSKRCSHVTWILADTWKRTCIISSNRYYSYHATRIHVCKHNFATDVDSQI